MMILSDIFGLSAIRVLCQQAKRAVCILSVIAVCFYCALPALAMETIIVGEVVDEATGEPIPNVNIHFRGSKIGTTTDGNGAYALRVDLKQKLQLIFSAVGYQSQRFEVEPGAMAGLQVALHERPAVLTEVVVSPGENPALEIIRQVREHREENDRMSHSEWTSTAKQRHTLYVSQIQRKHLRRALWRSLQSGMILQDDSTYILPLYEQTQTFRLEGKEMIPANDQQSRSIILSSTDYSALLNVEGNFDFYRSSIPVMGHTFLSPLANNGNLYYRYYIIEEEEQDSTHQSFVRISFRTRNPFYATFNGEMVIDTATYALRHIQVYAPVENSVNYLNQLHISQTLTEDNLLAEEHLSLLLDLAVKSEQSGTVFPTILLTTSLTGEACPASERSYPPQDVHTTYSDNGDTHDSIFSTLDSLPIIRTAKWFATIATTGYIPTGRMVDIGHIEEILQVNKHEGVHVGLPFRTNEKLSRVVSLEAAVGYGFRDRSFKGLGRVSVELPAPRRNILQLEYRDHYVWSEVDDFDRMLRENSIGYGNFDFTAYAFEALHRDSLCINTAIRQRQLQFHWFADWTPHLETHTYLRAGWQEGYAYQSLSLIARLSWGERKYDGYFSRRYGYSGRYPVLYLGMETGHWSQNGNNRLYGHIRVMLRQHAQLGIGGTLSYALQGGALFGSVPVAMLWQANANQGYAYDPYRFTMLHGGELLGDKYVSLQTEWNGMGILFNLIPGIRWLHLRELVEAKLAYGYLSPSHSLTHSPSHSLYGEVGVGIGNILRVCDLYSVWGFTPCLSASLPLSVTHPLISWGIRFRIHIGL